MAVIGAGPFLEAVLAVVVTEQTAVCLYSKQQNYWLLLRAAGWLGCSMCLAFMASRLKLMTMKKMTSYYSNLPQTVSTSTEIPFL